MEQIGGHHQFERQYCPTVDNISSVAFQSLDTVRALHQTVVSLRTALEEAHREIDTLKKQITITNDIEEGKKYRVENQEEQHQPPQQQLQSLNVGNVNKSITKQCDNNQLIGESVVPTSDQINANKQLSFDEVNVNKKSNKKKSTTIFVGEHLIHDTCKIKKIQFKPIVSDIKSVQSKKPMASKIDVKIRLSSNIKVDGSESSSDATTSTGDTTSDASAGSVTPRETSDVDPAKDDERITVNLTSREKIELNKTNQGIKIVRSSNENIHVDDGSSVHSVATIDETDDRGNIDEDSLFSDDATSSSLQKDCKLNQDINCDLAVGGQSPQRSTCDNQEEVDDIELIFSSDDKEYPQEDLVSISYYEPWQMCGQSGTPILVNFSNIGSDNERNPNQCTDKIESRENLSPSPIDPDRFYNAIKENVVQQQYSLESSDSLSVGDNLKRSFEFSTNSKGDDGDGIRRDESFDTFEQSGFASALGRRWTNYNVFMETDISKVGIAEENVSEKLRRNTCPNPPAYRPIIHREALGRYNLNSSNNNKNNSNSTSMRCPMAVKFTRNARNNSGRLPRPMAMETNKAGPKRSSSAQTDISALPEHWRSESHLAASFLGGGFFTLPSKFVPPPGSNNYKHPLKVSEKTREARRVLLSDINFTSMVPELSRSADHLCQGEHQQNIQNNNAASRNYGEGTSNYYKGKLLKTPDYAQSGITPSMSLTSPGVSQWTVNENSFGTQTTQTENYWSTQHGDSFDSCKSYSIGSKTSASFGKHNRSRSCSSVRCAICKHHHHGGIKMSESMHYTPRVTFQEPNLGTIRGSLPDLRPDCACGCPRARMGRNITCASRYGDSCASTESLIDEAEDFLRKSIDGVLIHDNEQTKTVIPPGRLSENDMKDFSPSKQTLPFLPKSSKCLKLGHLAKVIAKNGRVVIGRVRYVGPLVSATFTPDSDNETYVGLQLPTKIGDCNGSFEGRKFFDCEPQHGIFVPFKKIVMAWSS